MVRSPQFGRGTAEDRFRIDQFVGIVGGAAVLAVVAILIRGFTLWAAAHHEPVCQEQTFLWVVKLLDLFGKDQPGFLQALIDQL